MSSTSSAGADAGVGSTGLVMSTEVAMQASVLSIWSRTSSGGGSASGTGSGDEGDGGDSGSGSSRPRDPYAVPKHVVKNDNRREGHLTLSTQLAAKAAAEKQRAKTQQVGGSPPGSRRAARPRSRGGNPLPPGVVDDRDPEGLLGTYYTKPEMPDKQREELEEFLDSVVPERTVPGPSLFHGVVTFGGLRQGERTLIPGEIRAYVTVRPAKARDPYTLLIWAMGVKVEVKEEEEEEEEEEAAPGRADGRDEADEPPAPRPRPRVGPPIRPAGGHRQGGVEIPRRVMCDALNNWHEEERARKQREAYEKARMDALLAKGRGSVSRWRLKAKKKTSDQLEQEAREERKRLRQEAEEAAEHARYPLVAKTLTADDVRKFLPQFVTITERPDKLELFLKPQAFQGAYTFRGHKGGDTYRSTSCLSRGPLTEETLCECKFCREMQVVMKHRPPAPPPPVKQVPPPRKERKLPGMTRPVRSWYVKEDAVKPWLQWRVDTRNDAGREPTWPVQRRDHLAEGHLEPLPEQTQRIVSSETVVYESLVDDHPLHEALGKHKDTWGQEAWVFVRSPPRAVRRKTKSGKPPKSLPREGEFGVGYKKPELIQREGEGSRVELVDRIEKRLHDKELLQKGIDVPKPIDKYR